MGILIRGKPAEVADRNAFVVEKGPSRPSAEDWSFAEGIEESFSRKALKKVFLECVDEGVLGMRLRKGLEAPFSIFPISLEALFSFRYLSKMVYDPEKPVEKHRINLPHWQQDGTWIFLTWRLADSLPAEVVSKIRLEQADWEKHNPKPWDRRLLIEHNRLFTLRYETLLDDCHGACCLENPGAALIVADALHYFDRDRYSLDCYVVMPNHVHVLFQISDGFLMEDIVHSWKSFTAGQINKLLGRSGALWQREYFDRLIRWQRHLDWTRGYIAENPLKLRKGTFLLWRRDLPGP